ncbi:hypothetical protein NHX12_009590, partial [Muraenolepis orangiensis]
PPSPSLHSSLHSHSTSSHPGPSVAIPFQAFLLAPVIRGAAVDPGSCPRRLWTWSLK